MSSDKPVVVEADLSEGETPENSASDTAADSEVESAVPPKKKGGRGKWFLVFLLVVLLVGAAYGGWYFAREQIRSQQADFDQAMRAELAQLDTQLSELRDQVSVQSGRQTNIESAMVASATQIETQLLSLANRVSQTESTGSGEWVLAEAEYLLRIANQRLVTSQDIDGAIEMMRAADNILKELAYPELTEVRRQLVADITRLGMVQPVDYEGIYFSLDALLPSIASLSASKVEHMEAVALDSEAQSGWRKYWSAIVQALSPYVVINANYDTEPQYLISDDQESLVRSQIQLQIRQAQLAMMAAESSLYVTALDSAADQVEMVFVEDARAKSLSSSIRELAQRKVAEDTIDISQSIRALETVVDQLARVQTLDSGSVAE